MILYSSIVPLADTHGAHGESFIGSLRWVLTMARRCVQDGECIIPDTSSRNLCVCATVYYALLGCEGCINSIKKL
jgi:hypothetical protein